jgi:SAM-dependent methyltransferase
MIGDPHLGASDAPPGAPMDPAQIRFDDGAAYEDFMGAWSRLAGDAFLRWLAPPPGLRWVDVGCGNGAFTEMLVERCGPREVVGIDPSEGQLAFARPRLAGAPVQFRQGDATSLPWADGAFDAAVMALVLVFVPDPAKGVSEMARVVRPGGSVSAYMWDMPGGGVPYAELLAELQALGVPLMTAPSVAASRLDAMQALWRDAGMVDIETCEIAVRRTYPDFDAFWRIAQTGPRIAPALATLTGDRIDALKRRLRERLIPHADGRLTCSARANAVRGRVAY